MAQNVYSDLAHYCLTDQLALNSVAHPWVNGFTGRPYRDLRLSVPGAIDEVFNLTHMGIEGWVDKRHSSN